LADEPQAAGLALGLIGGNSRVSEAVSALAGS